MADISKRILYLGTWCWERSNGDWHRTDGPAFESDDGYVGWYLDNNHYDTVDEYLDANDYIDDEDKTLLKLKYG